MHEMHSPLGGLPTPLLAAICSFLPVRHNLSVSRQAFRDEAIVELALRRSHFALSCSTARQLAACSSQRSRAALGLVPSLGARLQCDDNDCWRQDLAALYQLTSVTAPSLFLFSHLTSLRFHIEAAGIQPQGEHDVDASAPLQGLLRLISESPASFASLARLHLSGYHSDALTVRSWDALACLQALTHLRVQSLKFSSESTASFLSALARLPVLEYVDLSKLDLHDSQALLTLDCHLWARRVNVLRLPYFSSFTARRASADRVGEFVQRLASAPLDDHASLSAPHRYSALHTLHLDLAVTTAAVLRAAFAVASLKELRFTNLCSAVDFADFWDAQLVDASWQSGLQRLELPNFHFSTATAADSSGQVSIYTAPRAAQTDHDRRLRALLARCVALTDLTVSLNTALEVSGCCLAPLHRLQRLRVNGWPHMGQLTASSNLSFPALRELEITSASFTDAALKRLLRACPALWSLRLEECSMQSWSVVSPATALCPQLVRLGVSTGVIASDGDVAAPQCSSPVVLAPVRTSLIVFSLVDNHRWAPPPNAILYDPAADLCLLASDPSSSRLRLLALDQTLTPQQLQQLRALPTLTQLYLPWDRRPHGVVCAAMQSLHRHHELERATGRLPAADRLTSIQVVPRELCELGMPAAVAKNAVQLVERVLVELCSVLDDLLHFSGVPVLEVKRRLMEELRSTGAD